jgi:putative SOS response-associated peptidase YedK
MCGRFSVSVDPFLVAERFQVELPEDARVRYNVAPTQPVVVVRRSRERGVVGDSVRWGLVPHWASDPSAGARMINVRAETLAEKPSFRSLLEKRRCLVPADGFYEWRTDPDGKRRPVRYTVAGGLFAFAGLWAVWRDPDSGEWLRSCTILTCPPNELVEPVHDRMPVILPREAEARWLQPELDLGEALDLLVPYRADEMAMGEVSRLLGSPDNDCAELYDPTWGAAPPPDEQLTLV